MDLKEIGGCIVDSSGPGDGQVARSCGAIINLSFPESARNFLIRRGTTCFSGGAVLHKFGTHPPRVQQTAGYCFSSVAAGDTVSMGTMTHRTSL